MAEIEVSNCKNGVDLNGWKITDPEPVAPAERRDAEGLVAALRNVTEFADLFPVGAMGGPVRIVVED
jgi:hypothetical protein